MQYFAFFTFSSALQLNLEKYVFVVDSAGAD